MDYAIMVALALQAAFLLVSVTGGFWAHVVFRGPAIYSMLLLAVMVADKY